MSGDFNASKPIYFQLAERINRQIVRGDLKAGERLPSVREMALQSGLNPNTVQRTYSELERMGIVETRRGQGTYVTEEEWRLQELRRQMKEEQIQGFIREMEEMGYTSEEILSDVHKILASKSGEA